MSEEGAVTRTKNGHDIATGIALCIRKLRAQILLWMVFIMPNSKSIIFGFDLERIGFIDFCVGHLTTLLIADCFKFFDKKLFSYTLPFGSLRRHYFLMGCGNNFLFTSHCGSSEPATSCGQKAYSSIAYEHAHRNRKPRKGCDGHASGRQPLSRSRHVFLRDW